MPLSPVKFDDDIILKNCFRFIDKCIDETQKKYSNYVDINTNDGELSGFTLVLYKLKKTYEELGWNFTYNSGINVITLYPKDEK